MAKLFTSWLVLSVSQHSLRRVILRHFSRIVVMKFQGKFASFPQLNSPNSRDKISREFRGMSHIIVNFTQVYQTPGRQTPGWYCELLHFYYTNWRLKTCTWRLHFSSLSPKDDLKIFLISSPAMSTPRKSWPEKTEGIWPTVLQGSTGETASWNWRRWPSSCEGEAT